MRAWIYWKRKRRQESGTKNYYGKRDAEKNRVN